MVAGLPRVLEVSVEEVRLAREQLDCSGVEDVFKHLVGRSLMEVLLKFHLLELFLPIRGHKMPPWTVGSVLRAGEGGGGDYQTTGVAKCIQQGLFE